MKTSSRLSVCALLALGSATLASAVTPGTVATCTIALTLTETAPGFPNGEYEKETSKGSVTTYEYKDKMVTSKVGVREVLAAMLEMDLLPDTVITGWGIIAVDVPSEEGDTNGSELVAVKTGRAPVAVPSSFYSGATASSFTGKYVYDEAKDTEKYTGSGNYKQAAAFTLFESESMYGVATSSEKWTEGILKVSGVNHPYAMFVDGTITLKGIVGAIWGDEGESEMVVEGSISLAAAKVADVESFLSEIGNEDF